MRAEESRPFKAAGENHPYPGFTSTELKTPGSGVREGSSLGLPGASLQTEVAAEPETIAQFAQTRGSSDAKLQLSRLSGYHGNPGSTGEGIICQHHSCYCLQRGLIRAR